MKRKYILMMIIAGAMAVAAGIAFLLPVVSMVRGLSELSDEKMRHLLYETDHVLLARELRNFANEMRWDRPRSNLGPQVFGQDDERVPASLREFAPKAIILSDDRITIDQGFLDLYFGIAVFPEGIVGEGLKELGPGVWYYSNTNKIPARK